MCIRDSPQGKRERYDNDRPQGKRDRYDNDRPRRDDRQRPHSDNRGDNRGPRRNDRDAGPRFGAAAEENVDAKPVEIAPELPDDVDASELHGEIRRDMRSLPKGLADKVALHLVAAGKLMDTDPEQALVHARYARHRASRIGAAREANGLCAYQMGEWTEALSELRAARRMGGGPGHIAIMADCERCLLYTSDAADE